MPLFVPVQPNPIALWNGESASNSTGVASANTAYLIPVVLPNPATLTGVRVKFGTGGSGHYDVGIYDATGTNQQPGNLLAHAAATATSLATSSAVVTPTLIGGNLALGTGVYWLAFWIDNATDTITKTASINTNMGICMSGTNNGPLPALASSLSSLTNASLKPLVVGILSGGFS